MEFQGRPAVTQINIMQKETASIRTLRRALETVGSEERLAAALNVAPLDLVRWLSGESPPPDGVFMAALDIVAGTRKRRHR